MSLSFWTTSLSHWLSQNLSLTQSLDHSKLVKEKVTDGLALGLPIVPTSCCPVAQSFKRNIIGIASDYYSIVSVISTFGFVYFQCKSRFQYKGTAVSAHPVMKRRLHLVGGQRNVVISGVVLDFSSFWCSNWRLWRFWCGLVLMFQCKFEASRCKMFQMNHSIFRYV